MHQDKNNTVCPYAAVGIRIVRSFFVFLLKRVFGREMRGREAERRFSNIGQTVPDGGVNAGVAEENRTWKEIKR